MSDTRGICAICGRLPLREFRIWFSPTGWLEHPGLCKACEAVDRPFDELERLTSREIEMGWATPHIKLLREGEIVTFRPHGNSMAPRVRSGQRCTVEPVDPTTIKKGEVVLCKVRGAEYLHLVSAVQDGRFQISNNHGHVNGWIGANGIYGRLVKVED